VNVKPAFLGVFALAALTLALSVCGGMSEAEKHYNAGVDFQEQGQLEEAKTEYDEAIRLNPELVLAYSNRGLVYIALGQHEKAVQDLDEAVRLNPELALAYSSRGVAYGVLGQPQRAIEDFTKAIHLDTQLPIAHAGRAVEYARLNMDVEAQQDVERAVELGFNCMLLIRTLKDSFNLRSGSRFQGPAFYLCKAPDFEIILYQGDDTFATTDLSISDLQGKPLVFNFWASWCPPCLAQIPDLQEFFDEYADRINLLGLDEDLGSNQDAKVFFAELATTYLAGYPLDEDVLVDYEVIGYPSTFFITADGRIFRQWTGPLNTDKLAEITEEMLTFTEPTR
jgi:tetratricopeptide (TPR) repeat protein